MAQFYFLSICLNLIAGLICIYGTKFISDKNTSELSVASDEKSGKSKKTAKDKKNKSEAEQAESTEIIDTERDSNADGQFISSEETVEEPKKRKILENIACFNNKNFRLVIGVLSVLVGLMKMLSVFRNDVPVIGDLIPCAAGLLSGFSLLLEYYLISCTIKPDLSDNLLTVFIGGRRYIGIFCLIAAVLHFIFPQVLLL